MPYTSVDGQAPVGFRVAFNILTWVRALTQPNQLTCQERMVAIVLARRANKEGEAWPSIRGIARDAGVSPHTVIKAVRMLEENGALSVMQQSGRVSRYKLLFDLHQCAICTSVSNAPLSDLHQPLSDLQRTVANEATEVTQEVSHEVTQSLTLLEDAPDFLVQLRDIPDWVKITAAQEVKLVAFIHERSPNGRGALQTATAVVAKYDPKKYKNPMAVFKNWFLRDIEGKGDGEFGSGTRQHEGDSPWDTEAARRRKKA